MADLLHANDPPKGYPLTWYAATAETPPEQPPLKGEAEADLCIVGGGFTGLATALAASEAGASVMLVEARRIGWGASGRNGGQVGSGQRVYLSELEERFGAEKGLALWQLGNAARDECRRLVEAHAP